LGHQFETALEQAERLAAELFGASDSMFLVNGTTCGLHYLLMPQPARTYSPFFAPIRLFCPDLGGRRGGFHPGQLRWGLADPAAANCGGCYGTDWKEAVPGLGSYPSTYYGTVSQLAELVRVAHERGVMVFVDEAHGGHFRFPRGCLLLD